uniref:peptidylprolyl isomerase n=1 Tax=Corethron hystrix TaxID=216773 RepID=A0A7S1BIM6_9STRA|mmetsp:Transcript_26881/g.61896  ORF Transcript_26881/g.61896 Transcript_26881/m.61896 type:complete len:298 (+) Transcript_26881:222-1115(+)
MKERNKSKPTQKKRKNSIDEDNTSHPSRKKVTLNNNDAVATEVKKTVHVNPETTNDQHERPKSKKELRAEKKALKKIATLKEQPLELKLSKEQKKLLRKESRKKALKEQRLLIMKKAKQDNKILKQKRLHREQNAKGGAKVKQLKKIKSKQDHLDKDLEDKKEKKSLQELDVAKNVCDILFNGSRDETTGTTTLRMGVKYKDVVEGKGPTVEDQTLVNVSYKLTGGKFGAVIDSSKKFSFRVGKGEVIKGWDIGVIGMRVGGRRRLTVPPKAGYGSQDIGAGPGAVLFFDITLLSMR